jgi:hypothetical protein
MKVTLQFPGQGQKSRFRLADIMFDDEICLVINRWLWKQGRIKSQEQERPNMFDFIFFDISPYRFIATLRRASSDYRLETLREIRIQICSSFIFYTLKIKAISDRLKGLRSEPGHTCVYRYILIILFATGIPIGSLAATSCLKILTNFHWSSHHSGLLIRAH